MAFSHSTRRLCTCACGPEMGGSWPGLPSLSGICSCLCGYDFPTFGIFKILFISGFPYPTNSKEKQVTHRPAEPESLATCLGQSLDREPSQG